MTHTKTMSHSRKLSAMTGTGHPISTLRARPHQSVSRQHNANNKGNTTKTPPAIFNFRLVHHQQKLCLPILTKAKTAKAFSESRPRIKVVLRTK